MSNGKDLIQRITSYIFADESLDQNRSLAVIQVSVGVLLLIFSLTYHFLKIQLIENFCWTALAINIISFFLRNFTRFSINFFIFGCFYLLVIGSLWAGGIEAPGFYWIPNAILLVAIIAPLVDAILWIILFSLGSVLLVWPKIFLPQYDFQNMIPDEALRFLQFSSAVGSATLLFLISTLFHRTLQIKSKQILGIKNELSDALADNKNLLRLISHDFSNHVMVLAHNSKSLAKVDGLSEQKNLKQIISTISRLKEMIAHLKELQSLKDKKKKVILSHINLKNILNTTLEHVHTLLEFKKIKVKINDFPAEWCIQCEPVSFSNMVLVNLLSNSIKFSQQEGVIEISVSKDNDKISLEILDYGIGIPEEMLKTIFNPTSSNSRKGTHGELGTGYGMPLVKSYMDLYEGSIQITSQTKDQGQELNETWTKIKLTFKAGI